MSHIQVATQHNGPGPPFCAYAQVRRALASWAFYTTKLRIEPILQWVYVNEQQAETGHLGAVEGRKTIGKP